MDKFEQNIKTIIDAIKYAAIHNNNSAYLYKNIAWYYHSPNKKHLVHNIIDVVISSKGDFNRSSFYKLLSKKISINKEIESSLTTYCVISTSYILRFKIIKNFNPLNIEDVKQLSNFSVDGIFYDVVKDNFIDSCGGMADLDASPIVIRSIFDIHHITTLQILEFAEKYGTFESCIFFDKHKNHLTTLKLSEFKEPIEITFQNIFLIFVRKVKLKDIKLVNLKCLMVK